jgi:hypothetical protein
MEREAHAKTGAERVDGRAAGRLQPVRGNPVGRGLLTDVRVVGVEEERELRGEQVLLVAYGRGLLDPVGVVEDDPEVADLADAGLRADGGLAGFDPRIAEVALLGLPGDPVEVDLLVGAAGDAEAPAAARVLVDEHDAVLLALVHRARGAGGDAGRVDAVLADAGEVEHERLLVLEADGFLGGSAQVRVLARVRGGSRRRGARAQAGPSHPRSQGR